MAHAREHEDTNVRAVCRRFAGLLTDGSRARGAVGELSPMWRAGSELAFAQCTVFNARAIRIAIWVLAVILPGGLALLALWAAARAVRARRTPEVLARSPHASTHTPRASAPRLLRVPSEPMHT